MYEVIPKYKPIVRILDAWVNDKGHLVGIVVDYPDNHINSVRSVVNGMEVTTSKIIKITLDENIVETMRTTYKVISWKRKPEKV